MSNHPAVQHVLDALVDHYHEMDDSDDEPVFGTYARTTCDLNMVTIEHETASEPKVLVIVREVSE